MPAPDHRSFRLKRRAGRGRRANEGGVDMPPPAPSCPPGWRTGPPDFIGVGVQRCGTTRWFDLISAHPDVVRPSAVKELHYFDRFHRGGCGAAELEAYQRYFPRPEGHRVGEWTPLYASAPWIPRLLAAAAPRARLLMLLRDPVERLLSGLALDAAVAARRGLPLSRYAPLEAFGRGLYHAQLVGLLSHFERSRVLVLQYERCSAEPQSQLARTFSFLELGEPDALPGLEEHPKRSDQKPELDPGTREAYVEAYRADVLRLLEACGELDVRLWPNFAHLV